MDVSIGKGITLDVNVDKLGFGTDIDGNLHPVAAHVIYIGLRNILMDSHAGVTSDEVDYVDKSRAVAEKKLAALYAGEVRTVGTREGDPVKAEAMRLAMDAVKAMIRKEGKKPSKADPKALRAYCVGYLERHPELVETARARVEQAKSVTADTVNLADLGL